VTHRYTLTSRSLQYLLDESHLFTSLARDIPDTKPHIRDPVDVRICENKKDGTCPKALSFEQLENGGVLCVCLGEVSTTNLPRLITECQLGQANEYAIVSVLDGMGSAA